MKSIIPILRLVPLSMASKEQSITPCSLRKLASSVKAKTVLSQTEGSKRQGMLSLSIKKLVSSLVKDFSPAGIANLLTSEPLRSQTFSTRSSPKKMFCMTTHIQTLFLMMTSQIPNILARQLSSLFYLLVFMYFRQAGANFWNSTNYFSLMIFTTKSQLWAFEKEELLFPPELSQFWHPQRLLTQSLKSIFSLTLSSSNYLWQQMENSTSWLCPEQNSSFINSLQIQRMTGVGGQSV